MSDVVIKLSAVDAASGVLERVAQNVRGVGKAADAQRGAFGALEQVAIGALRQIGAAAVNLAAAGIAALGDQLRTSIDVAANFESALFKFQAVAGDSLTKAGLSFDDVKAKALQLGSSTQFSAQQALDAMTELLKGGVNVKEVMTGATDATLALAAAAQLDLANAATIVAKQLGVWGETGVTAANVADLLASAANSSTVSVEELALGLANVGGSAKVAGLSFQETVQTMALIAPSFSSAADAGTSMKTFLQRLIPTTKDATEMMIKLGLATKDGKSKFFDATGSFIGMEKAAELLHNATKNLSEEQKFLALNTIFGSDAIRAAAAIAGAGASGYNEMGQAMKDAGGAAAAAAIMQQGYSYTLDQFNAAVETLQITVGSALLPHLTQLVSAAAEGVNAFTAWTSGILSAADPVAALAAQIGLVGVTTDGVQQTVAVAAAAIFAAWDTLSAALAPSTQEAWNAVQATVQTALAAVQQAIQFATALVVQIWNAHGADILAFAKRTWEGVMGVVTAAARFVQAAIEALVAAAQWIWANFGNEITTIAQFAWSLIKTLTETALAVLRGLFEAGTAALRGDWNAAWEAIKGVAEALWNGIKASAEHLMNTLSSLFQTLYPRLEAAFRQALAAAPSLGEALIDGIRSGVESAARGLAQAAANAAKAALDAAKAALGIRSPSRVAAREVGVPLAEGILRGLTEGLAPLPLLTRDAVTQPPPASATVNVGGITVNAAPGMDERRVATLVRSEIDNLTRLARFGRV
jgi:TP901 family phage tail tape measure protein